MDYSSSRWLIFDDLKKHFTMMIMKNKKQVQ